MQLSTLQSASFTHLKAPFFSSCSVGVHLPWTSLTHAYDGPFSRFSWGEGRNVDKQDWFVTEVETRKLGRALGMSTKPSRRLARHWMGLSSGDNWLSIRDRDNNVRVGRKAVNHYLSVRRPWLPQSRLHSLHSLSLFCSLFSLWGILLFHFLSCCLKLLPRWYLQYVWRHFVSPCDLSEEWSLHSPRQDNWASGPRFKGLPEPPADCCHSRLALLKGQTVSVTFSRLHTLTYVRG